MAIPPITSSMSINSSSELIIQHKTNTYNKLIKLVVLLTFLQMVSKSRTIFKAGSIIMNSQKGLSAIMELTLSKSFTLRELDTPVCSSL